MTAGGGRYTRIDHPSEIQESLDVLYQPGGALLVMDAHPALPLPVLLAAAELGGVLRLDATAIRASAQVRALREGQGFRVTGRGPNGIVRTPVLTAEYVWESDHRLYCQCPFPAWLELLQRRDTFRARLHYGMPVKVELHDEHAAACGLLRDLSLTGCLVEAELAAATLLDDERQQPLELAMTFPDGSRFTARARLQHQALRNNRLLCGFRFEPATREQEQQLWFLVRETEREAARNAASGKAGLRPSKLFAGSAFAGAAETDADVTLPPRR